MKNSKTAVKTKKPAKTKVKKVLTIDPRTIIRMLVRVREDMQTQRINADNRFGRKADGTSQNVIRNIDPGDVAVFAHFADGARELEDFATKELEEKLNLLPIWTDWLQNIKGLSVVAAAYIVGEFNIHVADTVSKLWQYAGLNSGMVRGKKRVKTDKASTYQPDKPDEEVVYRGADYVIVKTNKMVRGDRLTDGFTSPFNGRLRKALCGIMGMNFIKSQNSYAMEFYYPYKERLKQSEKMTTERAKNGVVKNLMWKDASDGHQHQAAVRFMVKAFLRDLYAAWRAMEGLPVRAPYQEEYLGHVHGGQPGQIVTMRQEVSENPAPAPVNLAKTRRATVPA